MDINVIPKGIFSMVGDTKMQHMVINKLGEEVCNRVFKDKNPFNAPNPIFSAKDYSYADGSFDETVKSSTCFSNQWLSLGENADFSTWDQCSGFEESIEYLAVLTKILNWYHGSSNFEDIKDLSAEELFDDLSNYYCEFMSDYMSDYEKDCDENWVADTTPKIMEILADIQKTDFGSGYLNGMIIDFKEEIFDGLLSEENIRAAFSFIMDFCFGFYDGMNRELNFIWSKEWRLFLNVKDELPPSEEKKQCEALLDILKKDLLGDKEFYFLENEQCCGILYAVSCDSDEGEWAGAMASRVIKELDELLPKLLMEADALNVKGKIA